MRDQELQSDSTGVIEDSTSAIHSTSLSSKEFEYERIIGDICNLNWTTLSRDELIGVAWVYYYFSIQFRESLETARQLFPDDPRLLELDRGERDTDNLSPWPGVAGVAEKMNHDEFMRRTLTLSQIPQRRQRNLEAIGEAYLSKVRAVDENVRALALASYEDGGLESVFRAILTAPGWDGPLLQAFKHFLVEHIKFDSDPEQGHGALCRHLPPDDRVAPLWEEFKNMFVKAAPSLMQP
jgi:hypothetical protein